MVTGGSIYLTRNNDAIDKSQRNTATIHNKIRGSIMSSYIDRILISNSITK